MHALEPIVYSVLILMMVGAIGLILGNIKVRGIGLGVAGVLFAGILVAQLKPAVDLAVLAFARDFGLILFVYMTGLHVGRGFLSALRKQGWSLNLLAFVVVLGGAVVTAAAVLLGKVDMAVAVGIFSGATTNTPSLGAAQEAIKAALPGDVARAQLPVLGYAISYPFGVIGIILSILVIRFLFRIDPADEVKMLQEQENGKTLPLQRWNLVVRNQNLDGRRLGDIPGLRSLGVVVSRVRSAESGEIKLAHPDNVLRAGDVLLVVGPAEALEQFRITVGEISDMDLAQQPGQLTLRRVVVTNKPMVGKTLRELHLPQSYGVNVTRVSRADIEMSARADLRIEFGDLLHIVGDEKSLAKVAGALGNSIKDLSHTDLIAVFLGIALGIFIGLAPIHLPGLPSPVRLGLAGGPLLVAIIMSRLGKIGPIICYVPPSANVALREMGIALFLAAIGLKSGEHFMATLMQGEGVRWIAWGFAVTLLPLLAAAAIGRLFLKMNFVSLCGLMAGSMTDPPALAFANSMTRSDLPAVAYAAVYPITMLLRVLAAQILVLAFVR